MKVISDFIVDLQNRYNQKKLIPFIGAGFSINIGNYPGWDKFIELLQDELQENGSPVNFEEMFGEKDPAECTQFFYWKAGDNKKKNENISQVLTRGKEKFCKFVSDKFEQPTYASNLYKQHELLIKKFSRIYTTNWDELLETTCSKMFNPCGYERLYSIREKANWGSSYKEKKCINGEDNNSKRTIIKFHGCQTDETFTSIIASSADYYERMRVIEHHPLDVMLRGDMKQSDFLFIGYSLRDLNVKYIMNQIEFQKWTTDQENKNKLYFITFDNPEDNNAAHLDDYREKCNSIIPITLCPAGHCVHEITKEIKGIEKEMESITANLKIQKKEDIENLNNGKKKKYKDEICEFLKNLGE